MILWLALAIVSVALSAAFSGMETGLYSLERVRLQVRSSEGDSKSARLLKLILDPVSAVATILLVNNLVNFLVTASTGQVVQGLLPTGSSEGQLELVNTAVVAPTLFVLGELLPKSLFLAHPLAFSRRVLPLYLAAEMLFGFVARPIIRVMSFLGGGETPTKAILARAGLLEALTVGDESTALTSAQRVMVRRLSSLEGVRACDCMIPLADVAIVWEGGAPAEILQTAARTSRSRLPVLAQDGKRFQGYVVVMDLILGTDGAPQDGAPTHSLPAVHQDESVLDVLGKMREACRPLAEVLGTTATGQSYVTGLISSADIVDLLFRREQGGGTGRHATSSRGRT